jgi:hypothetical protein
MSFSRDLLSLSPLFRVVPALGSWALLTSCQKHPNEQTTAHGSGEETGTTTVTDQKATYDFWTKEVRDPQSVGTRKVGGTNARRATFVYNDPENGFLARQRY